MLETFCFYRIISCKKEKESTALRAFKTGCWGTKVSVLDKEVLPFIFEAKNDGVLVIHNTKAVIVVMITGNSTCIQTFVFVKNFLGRFRESGNRTTRSFIKPSLDRSVPFILVYGKKVRFEEQFAIYDEKPTHIDITRS